MLEPIINQLLEIFSACRLITEDQILNGLEDLFRPHMESLNRLAALEIDDQAVETLMADRSLKPAIAQIAKLKRIHGLRMERQQAQALIDSSAPWDILKAFIYYPNYLQLAQMESRGADLRRGDRVVFIGSGPLPLSLIAMVNQCAMRGIGIERDPLNAELSRKVLSALALNEEIEIILGDHFVLPLPHPCSLVLVGADAIPKEEIFRHLAKTLPGGMKLSYRIYEKGLRRLFDMDHVGRLPQPLMEYRRIRPQPPVNNTSVFVVKGNDHV